MDGLKTCCVLAAAVSANCWAAGVIPGCYIDQSIVSTVIRGFNHLGLGSRL